MLAEARLAFQQECREAMRVNRLRRGYTSWSQLAERNAENRQRYYQAQCLHAAASKGIHLAEWRKLTDTCIQMRGVRNRWLLRQSVRGLLVFIERREQK